MTTSKSKKNKKKKSKSAKANGDKVQQNGLDEEQDGDDSEQQEPAESTTIESAAEDQPETEQEQSSNGATDKDMSQDEPVQTPSDMSTGPDPGPRLEAAAMERDRLRDEVVELRKALEDIQKRHEDEKTSLNSKLEESESSKAHVEGQYQKLRTQVNTIRSQLAERLKADAVCPLTTFSAVCSTLTTAQEELSQARTQIEDLQDQNKTMTDNHDSLQTQITQLNTEKEQQAQEISDLRGRTNVSQQNWAKERDDLLSKEAQIREEFEAAKQAMQDWEVLAMEERSVREGLGDRVTELEDQLSTQKEAYEKAASERDSQSATVDGLQRALHDIQEGNLPRIDSL